MSSQSQPFHTTHSLRVFLCHSSQDKPAVRTLYHRLLAEGVAPWLDEEDLVPGQSWRDEIPKAVRAADVVLVCLSRQSLTRAGYVHKEIKLALDVADEQPEGSIFMIPVRLEECAIPDRLSNIHYVNLFEERGYERLLRALHLRADQQGRVIAPRSEPSPSPAPAPAPPPQPRQSAPPRPQPKQPASPVVKLPGGVTLELVEVPEGPFLMGSSDDDPAAGKDEKPQHELTLPTYWIGKTPVTNAQFRPFVEGDGYTNPDYWSDEGWQWREKHDQTQPFLWHDSRWNGAAYPVVRIAWYEAMAYTAWLSAQTGEDYRLPSEAEWEKAARGPDGRIYPWGNQWEAGRCNSEDAGKQLTTPVGSYPAGASPYGALDMAGNVWEWTSSQYRSYPYDPNDGREDISNPAQKRFTLRGGSTWRDRTYVRCAARDRVNPNFGGGIIGYGLRVLLSPRGSP
jgi:formylglycine-generating enzyme required for sulfatase activity